MILNDVTFAWLGLWGNFIGAIGGIYLTYDLLGGHKGPLGFITRMATYGLIFGLAYGLVFGPYFGAVAGVGLGAIFALEFWLLARHQRIYHSSPIHNVPSLGILRGGIVGLAAIKPFGLHFGILFGCVNVATLYIMSRLHVVPAYAFDYINRTEPKLSRRTLINSLQRGLIFGLTGAFAGWMERGGAYALGFGLLVGITVGVVSVGIGMIAPGIEWWMENIPEKKLGVLGFILIGAGLLLQSVQYALVILKISVHH